MTVLIVMVLAAPIVSGVTVVFIDKSINTITAKRQLSKKTRA